MPTSISKKPSIQPKPLQQASSEDEEDDDDDDDRDSDAEEEDDDEDEESDSNDKKKRGGKKGGAQVGAINEMYQKYKKYQELLAKYSTDAKGAAGGDEDSSITISKSQ